MHLVAHAGYELTDPQQPKVAMAQRGERMRALGCWLGDALPQTGRGSASGAGSQRAHVLHEVRH
ncbi:MAG TPA: hypothetical protein VMV93_04720, partial [Chloroflexota bacterium]|nr:hypothetical protein [Chloroflexota bacterium]